LIRPTGVGSSAARHGNSGRSYTCARISRVFHCGPPLDARHHTLPQSAPQAVNAYTQCIERNTQHSGELLACTYFCTAHPAVVTVKALTACGRQSLEAPLQALQPVLVAQMVGVWSVRR